MGVIGWLVDLAAGTGPLFLIVFAVFGVIGSFVSFYYRYQAADRPAGRGKAVDQAHTLTLAVGPREPRGSDRPTHRPPRGARRPGGDPRRRGVPRRRRRDQRGHRPRARRRQLPRRRRDPHVGGGSAGPARSTARSSAGSSAASPCSPVIVLALEPVSFIDIPVLVLTIAVTHIALLFWETRYVSLTLAAPGPQARCRQAHPGRGVARQPCSESSSSRRSTSSSVGRTSSSRTPRSRSTRRRCWS